MQLYDSQPIALDLKLAKRALGIIRSDHPDFQDYESRELREACYELLDQFTQVSIQIRLSAIKLLLMESSQ